MSFKLVASMMVGPAENDRYLTSCINHLLEFCDEICLRWEGVMGTLVTYPDPRIKVLQVAETFYAHEGRARQELLDFTLAQQPTHILAIDADEFIADGAVLRNTLEQARRPIEATAWQLCMQEIWNVREDGLEIRQDGGWEEHDVPIVWAPGQTRGLRLPDRALACGRTPTQMKARAGHSGTAILHFGWTARHERRARYDRYALHDGGRYHASKHLDSILWGDDAIDFSWREWPEALLPHRPSIEELTGIVVDVGSVSMPAADARHMSAMLSQQGEAILRIDGRGNAGWVPTPDRPDLIPAPATP